MTTAKPVSAAQINRINALLERNLITIDAMPTTSWEASAIIRTSPASKRDKEQLKNSGGRVLTRMSTGELEMTTKVLDSLRLLELSTSKDEKIHEAVAILRKQFTAMKSQ